MSRLTPVTVCKQVTSDCSLFRCPRTVAPFRSPGLNLISIVSAYLPLDISTDNFTWGTWVLTASFLMEQKGFAPLENFLVFGRLSADDDNDDGDDVLNWEFPSLPLELHRQTDPCLSSQIQACVLCK